jgi:hypothetical protein
MNNELYEPVWWQARRVKERAMKAFISASSDEETREGADIAAYAFSFYLQIGFEDMAEE